VKRIKRKPKFRLGQKVVIYRLQGRIASKDGPVWLVSVAGFSVPCYSDELRHLSKREKVNE
jgi:hypothetical protein